jgi:hypothetical protein
MTATYLLGPQGGDQDQEAPGRPGLCDAAQLHELHFFYEICEKSSIAQVF